MKVGNIMPTYRFLPREFYIRTTEEEILKFMTKKIRTDWYISYDLALNCPKYQSTIKRVL